MLYKTKNKRTKVFLEFLIIFIILYSSLVCSMWIVQLNLINTLGLRLYILLLKWKKVPTDFSYIDPYVLDHMAYLRDV
jgi:hypothetical protein